MIFFRPRFAKLLRFFESNFMHYEASKCQYISNKPLASNKSKKLSDLQLDAMQILCWFENSFRVELSQTFARILNVL